MKTYNLCHVSCCQFALLDRVGWKHQIHSTLKIYFIVIMEYPFFFSNYFLRKLLFLLKERLASLLKHLVSSWYYQHSDLGVKTCFWTPSVWILNQVSLPVVFLFSLEGTVYHLLMKSINFIILYQLSGGFLKILFHVLLLGSRIYCCKFFFYFKDGFAAE